MYNLTFICANQIIEVENYKSGARNQFSYDWIIKLTYLKFYDFLRDC